MQLRYPMVTSGAGDGTVKLWNVTTAKCVKTFINNSNCKLIWNVRFDEDKMINGASNAVEVWDVTLGKFMYKLTDVSCGMNDRVTTLQLYDNQIISGSSTGPILFFDFDTSARKKKKRRMQ